MNSCKVTFQEFDIFEQDGISERWVRFIAKLERYFELIDNISDAKKVSLLFIHGGYDLDRLYQDRYKDANHGYTEIIKTLSEHFNPKANIHLNI